MMKEQEHSAKFLRQRRFMLVLPLLVIPFLTMLFWALGGGKVSGAEASQATYTGFNKTLPGPTFKDEKPLDKLGVYQQADRDSARMRERRKAENRFLPYLVRKDVDSVTSGSHQGPDDNEARVMRKLSDLNKALVEPSLTTKHREPREHVGLEEMASMHSGDIDRLENMMKTIHQKDTAVDPEMQQLSAMLDKVMTLQHPDQTKDTLPMIDAPEVPIDTIVSAEQNGFYSLVEDEDKAIIANSFSAEIAETQTLVSGAMVKLRLLEDLPLKKIVLTKESLVYGRAALSGERLQVTITSVQVNNKILQVSLNVYDLDGNAGIYVPGAITRDVMKQSAHEAAQGFNIGSLDPSIAAQVAGLGIDAAKKLFGKKLRQVKVTVPEGYRVCLTIKI